MLKIVHVPNDVLTTPTKKVKKIDNSIKKLVLDMKKTLVAQDDPPGVGLAANQVGQALSLFIMKTSPSAKTEVFINPEIIEKVEDENPLKKMDIKDEKLEGCLSIPRLWSPVRRAQKVFLKYQTLDGETHETWFTGFKATIVQHEVDHLIGHLFIQRALEQGFTIYEEKDGKLVPKEL